ncbi:MAG: hypothetical protein GXP29_01995 [Planctomycetes bacterium]|nr:hypothetical protein [Planctomycetota bacterium]
MLYQLSYLPGPVRGAESGPLTGSTRWRYRCEPAATNAAFIPPRLGDDKPAIGAGLADSVWLIRIGRMKGLLQLGALPGLAWAC